MLHNLQVEVSGRLHQAESDAVPPHLVRLRAPPFTSVSHGVRVRARAQVNSSL